MAEQQAEWEQCRSARGRAYLDQEVKAAKLSAYERAQLGRLMERVARSEILQKDVTPLPQYGLYELRYFADRRDFRLLYAKRDGGRLLVAALFVGKKSARLPPAIFQKAAKRVQAWDQAH